jgi:hypothetical protein
MRQLAKLSVAFALLAPFSGHCEQSTATREKIVHNFVAAFNAHDIDAMSAFVTDDVQWLSVDADKITTETNSKPALRSAMSDYFKGCPTCRSRLTQVIATQNRVSAIEEASWKGKDGPKRQSSLSVYEFSEDLIKRIYYFPAEK